MSRTREWDKAAVDRAKERISGARVVPEMTEEQVVHRLRAGKIIMVSTSIDSPMSTVIDIDPIGAPRQTRRDAWKPSPAVQRYRAWKDKMRPACEAAGWKLGSVLRAEFEITMPASWSKKKKAAMNGQPHQQKPDVDNCCKALMDLEGVDDGHVHTLQASKRWAEKGRIILYY